MKADLYREAGAFCAKQNKNLVATGSDQRDAGMARYASAGIEFRCLDVGDRDLRRPTMEATPNVRIKMKR